MLARRYLLGDRIGTGGTSHVHEARDVVLDRPVAVKLLDEAAATTADPALRRRFESESRTAAQFIHPNAVAIFDAGIDQGQLFLVMELVSGGTLADRLSRVGPMTSADAARLGAQIASALAAAHAVGIIHRDVKPANVLLDERGNAKLADFGIARRFDEIEDALTSTGMVMGTRHYVSPEQAYGQPLGPPTDIFSLGVLLYEAVTGVRPPSAIDRAADRRLDVRAVDASVDPRLAERDRTSDRHPGRGPIRRRRANGGDPHGCGGIARACDGADVVHRHHARAPPTGTDGRGGRDGGGGATTPSARTIGPAAAMPLVGDRLLDERRHRQRLLRIGGGIVALVLIGAALAVALSMALGDDDPGITAVTTTAQPAAAVTTVAPATTIAPTTVAPTTVAPTTMPPTTSRPPRSRPPPSRRRRCRRS